MTVNIKCNAGLLYFNTTMPLNVTQPIDIPSLMDAKREIAPRDPQDVLQSSRLFTIPGEIRNIIYDIAILDMLSQATLPGIAHPKREAKTIREAQSLTRNWHLFRRSYLGLTQASRQLRKEFLPTYQYRIPITVRLAELKEYAATFVQHQKVANIRVEIHDTVETPELGGVILLCAMSKHILIDFGRSYQQRSLLNILEYPTSYIPFYNFLYEKVDKVIVGCESITNLRRDGSKYQRFWIDRLDVYVRPEYAEEWMMQTREALTEGLWEELIVDSELQTSLGSWRVKLGLPGSVNIVPKVDQLTELEDWISMYTFRSLR